MKHATATNGTIVQTQLGRTADMALAMLMIGADDNAIEWHRVHYARRFGLYLPGVK